MRERKFTLGTWRVANCKDRKTIDILSDNFCPARAHGCCTTEKEANAHLIASAPELLEALEMLLCNFKFHMSLNPHLEEITEKAIAKAYGEQP